MNFMKDAMNVTTNLILGDCSERLDDIEDESIQLVVTSPPYNIGKEYETDTKMSLEEYRNWLTPIIEKLCEKISHNGSLCWQVGNFVKDGEVFPLDMLFYEIIARNGFKLRNRIIWQFNFGLHAQKRFSGRYETLLWFTKSNDYYFNLDPVRVPQKYPGKRHPESKGDKAGRPSGNKLGKNPSDFWTFDPTDAFSNPVWEIPNVKANHPEKTTHPCQFPIELVERCILSMSKPDDTILDPFLGAGTTVLAALKNGRNSVGIEKSPAYLDIAKKRILDFESNSLKYRPLGKKIYKPKVGEKVAEVPKEWG